MREGQGEGVFEEQTAQSLRRSISTIRKPISPKSQITILPKSGLPIPAKTLIASTAPKHPIVPDTAPSTGNSRFHSVGGEGYRHARHAVFPGTIVVTDPSISYIAHS